MSQMDPGSYTAVFDRLEETPTGDLAVFVVEHDGDPTAQLDLPLELVPEAGRSVDSVFELTVEPHRVELAYRDEETTRRAESSQARFDRLAQRPPGNTEDEDER